MLFTGQYEHSIDSKLRVAIPSEIRGRMDPEKDGSAFYATMGPNGAIWLWPERAFEDMAEDIDKAIAMGTVTMDFDEATFPEAHRAEPDKTGRIRLPEEMLAEAGIGSKVMILGMRTRLELRDPDDWTQRRKANSARRAEIIRQAAAARGQSRDNA